MHDRLSVRRGAFSRARMKAAQSRTHDPMPLTNRIAPADDVIMSSKEPNDSPQDEGLSARMRELISIATVEERRKPTSQRSDPKGERRRRTDPTVEPEKKAS